MRTLLNILLLAIIAGILFSCGSRKSTTSTSVTNIVDSVRIKDSLRIRDSVRIIQKDSTVIREGMNTGTEITPCEGKLKAFRYTLTRGNFKLLIAGDTTGKIWWDINFEAEVAYREKLYQEYREHLKDSFAAQQKVRIEYKYLNNSKTITRTVWPWWLWVLIGYAVITLFLKLQYPIKSLYQHWFTKTTNR